MGIPQTWALGVTGCRDPVRPPASRPLGSAVADAAVAPGPPPRHRSAVKVRDVLRLLAADGWYLARTRGSHAQYKHPTKPGLVTVAGSGSDDLASGTLNSILKQAGLKGSGPSEAP